MMSHLADIDLQRDCVILCHSHSGILPTMPPRFTIDRPLPWTHFRLTVEGWHPLVAMYQPNSATRWDELHELGIHQVLRLSEESQPYDPAPLRMLGMIPLEDLNRGGEPTDPEHEERQLNDAVRLLKSGLKQGGVVIHCVGGRGRTGTVIGGFLHSLGIAYEEIPGMLDRAYKDAGRPGWPESPWQGEVIGRIHL
jgi:Tyrosine phosphatase family